MHQISGKKLNQSTDIFHIYLYKMKIIKRKTNETMHEHRVNTTGAQELKNKKVNIAPVTKDRCDVNQLCILLL
jgi:hypothetical protein